MTSFTKARVVSVSDWPLPGLVTVTVTGLAMPTFEQLNVYGAVRTSVLGHTLDDPLLNAAAIAGVMVTVPVESRLKVAGLTFAVGNDTSTT